jgi:hypothetical protein
MMENEILSFGGKKWMELDIFMVSEINQTQADNYCRFPLMYEIWGRWGHESRRGLTYVEGGQGR